MDEKVKIGRMKTFKEMNNEEKIDLLQRELARTQETLAKVCHSLLILERHQHSPTGIVIPIRLSNQEEDYGSLRFRVHRWEET